MNDEEHFDWVKTKWNEHVSKRGLPTELEYPYGKVPITRCLEMGARTHPERPAVRFYGRDVSYRELDEWSNRFANFLLGQGYGRGNWIALHLYNCPQYLVSHFGGMKGAAPSFPWIRCGRKSSWRRRSRISVHP